MSARLPSVGGTFDLRPMTTLQLPPDVVYAIRCFTPFPSFTHQVIHALSLLTIVTAACAGLDQLGEATSETFCQHPDHRVIS